MQAMGRNDPRLTRPKKLSAPTLGVGVDPNPTVPISVTG